MMALDWNLVSMNRPGPPATEWAIEVSTVLTASVARCRETWGG